MRVKVAMLLNDYECAECHYPIVTTKNDGRLPAHDDEDCISYCSNKACVHHNGVGHQDGQPGDSLPNWIIKIEVDEPQPVLVHARQLTGEIPVCESCGRVDRAALEARTAMFTQRLEEAATLATLNVNFNTLFIEASRLMMATLHG